MSNTFTMTGRLGDDVQLRFSPQGKAVANGRIADTPRRLNQQTNQWEDAGETLWLSFALWGPKAESLAESAHKGDLVMATGKLRQRSYDANDGTKRTVIELDAADIAIVPRSSAKPRNDQWAGNQSQPAQSGWGGQQADPWATPGGGQQAPESAPF